MATISVGTGAPNQAVLSVSQTGGGASTNTADRGGRVDMPALLKITTTVGATPTCTYSVDGSTDGVNWFPVAYSDVASPETIIVATFAITSAGTVAKLLKVNQPWRYFRMMYSANTNVTNNAELWVF